LFLDYRGYVAEATGANIFFVQNGEVHTPIPDAILDGITRRTVIGMLKDKGITVHERRIQLEELEGFELLADRYRRRGNPRRANR
jgi:branched-chain amino acid aminotransferase